MSDFFSGADHKAWADKGLKDFGDYAECVEYVEQEDDYGDSLRGSWFYGDEDNLTLYYGTFGNYNSPGASHFTYAEVYDDEDEFLDALAEWEAKEEYLDNDDDYDDEEEEDEEDAFAYDEE